MLISSQIRHCFGFDLVPHGKLTVCQGPHMYLHHLALTSLNVFSYQIILKGICALNLYTKKLIVLLMLGQRDKTLRKFTLILYL